MESYKFLEDDINIDEELVIDLLSPSLFLESIIGQFDSLENEIINNNDLIKPFYDKYNLLENYYIKNEDSESLKELDSYKYDFFNTILNRFHTNLGLEIKFSSLADNATKEKYIYFLYRYFVCYYVDHITNFIVNSILEQEANIINMKSNINKKDIEFTIIKKELNTDHAAIVYFVSEFIDSLELDDINEYINKSSINLNGVSGYEEEAIQNLFKENNVEIEYINHDPNRIINYIKYNIKNNHSIEMSIKNILLVHYKNKENKDTN